MARALEILHPTGNPFIDLCMWKGRFPSRRAQFCTQHLKSEVIDQQVMQPLIDDGHDIVSWQGVRKDESAWRNRLEMWEERDWHFIYRPILEWSGQDSIDKHHQAGIKPNALYSLGMGRVGCMPCINVNKGELREIVHRFPDQIDRIAEWEQIVSKVAKYGCSTFIPVKADPHISTADSRDITAETHGIKRLAEWAMTARGGRQYDLLATDAEPKMCSSSYGLCE